MCAPCARNHEHAWNIQNFNFKYNSAYNVVLIISFEIKRLFIPLTSEELMRSCAHAFMRHASQAR